MATIRDPETAQSGFPIRPLREDGEEFALSFSDMKRRSHE